MTTADWLTPSKAAPLLGMSPAKVRALCADRAIERRNIGTAHAPRYSIHRDSIRAYNRQAVAR